MSATESGLRLNYKRTFLIGFAFFGILLLWQVYDSWCPTYALPISANEETAESVDFGQTAFDDNHGIASVVMQGAYTVMKLPFAVIDIAIKAFKGE